ADGEDELTPTRGRGGERRSPILRSPAGNPVDPRLIQAGPPSMRPRDVSWAGPMPSFRAGGQSMKRPETRPDADPELLPPALARLIALEPDVSSEPPGSRYGRLAQLKASVKRDLQWLLNARRPLVDLPPGCKQLRESLLTFGLP